MNDYFGGRTLEDLEALLKRLVAQGAEGPKLDFKASLDLDSKGGQAEVAKDISSIANTDDENRLDDIGYIIVGAERGRIIGTPLFGGDPDKLQARLTDTVKNFVSPLPLFSLVVFDEAGVGCWGAIVIPPSAQQPHVLIRDGAAGMAKHDWLVRVNDTTERAAPHDYTRMLGKAVRRAVRPVESELQRLALRLDQSSTFDVDAFAHAVKHAVGSSGSTPEPHDRGDLSAQIRAKLVQDDLVVEDALLAEALRLWEVMTESSDLNPWTFGGRTPEQLRSILSYLEEQSAPLAMALATIARYDKGERYTQAAVRALAAIARQPEPTGPHHPQAGYFRLYPLVLCLHALIIIAAKERRAGLLQQILSLELEEGDHIEPIVNVFDRIRASYEVFNAALEKRYFEPVPVRVRDAFVPRLSSLLAGTRALDAFCVAEFVIGLAFLSTSQRVWNSPAPLPGMYLYEYDARRVLNAFLRKRPEWLSDVLGVPLPELLTAFDVNAVKAVHRAGLSNGFLGGARKVYDGGA